MLQDEIWPVICTGENIEDLIFMQDGAPPHLAIIVCEWLNTNFPGRQMSCLGLHVWLARSFYLTLSNFFLWS